MDRPLRPRRHPALLPLAALLLAACRSNELPPSRWPPPDFALEVREETVTSGQPRTVRSFRVWADGLCAFRSSDADLPGLPWTEPVFDTLAVYRLDPHSTRSLCRALEAAGLFREEARRLQNEVAPGPDLVVRWTAMGSSGQTGLRTHDRVQVERAIEAVAGYLPPGVRFLGIEPDASHLSDVPTPRHSLQGAVAATRDLARARPTDFDLLLDLFVVAVADRDWNTAREALTEMQNGDGRAMLGDEADLIDWKTEALPRLRALLPARRGGE